MIAMSSRLMRLLLPSSLRNEKRTEPVRFTVNDVLCSVLGDVVTLAPTCDQLLP